MNEGEHKIQRSVNLHNILLTLLSAGILALMTGCAGTKIPIPAEWYLKDPAVRQVNLIVFLRGAGGSHLDFKAYGLVDAVWAKGLPYDIVAPDSHIGYVRERIIHERLKLDILDPARGMGYERVWLVGASLGGQSALWYDWNYPGEIEGLVMMSPFLSWGGMIREVDRAGGLQAWEPGQINADDWQRMVWSWLKARSRIPESRPQLWLAYGQDDFFRDGHQLLAAGLPEERVISIPGGHDYKTFRQLWDALLERLPLQVPTAP